MGSAVRSFLAIEIPSDLLDSIIDIQDELKKSNSQVKYVEKENLHITLKFFGEITQDKVEDIVSSTENILKNYKPTILSLKNLGAFPNKDYLKVLWVGIEKNNILLDIQKALDNEYSELGFKKERNFTSHITLGRVKGSKNKNQLKEIMKTNSDISIGEMNLNKIVLKKSVLTPNGPIYSTIHSFEL